MNDAEVIAWLESAEGEKWSYKRHNHLCYFGSIKSNTILAPGWRGWHQSWPEWEDIWHSVSCACKECIGLDSEYFY